MVAVFGLFLLLFFPAHVHPLVVVDPSPFANVTYGKPFFFNCTFPSNWKTATLNIPGEQGFKFATFNDGHCEVPFDRRKNYSIACHGDTLTYGILKPVDQTTWRCTYRYTNSTTSKRYEEHGITTVILQPDKPVTTLQKTNYIISEGAHLTIPCTFSGAPISSVTWEHNNTVMETSNQNQPLILSFWNVSRTAAGNYTCNVTVSFKGTYTTSKKVNLVVEYPPTLRSSNDTTVNEGTDTITLFCDILVDGFPRNYSNLHWQHWRKNQLIRELDSDDTHVNPNGNKHTLTLTSVGYSDTGCYKCLMGNGVPNLEGKINQTAQVDVVIKAIPRILDPKPEYHGQVGKRFKIKFELVGHPAPKSSIIVLEGQADYKINKTETKGPVNLVIYNKIVKVDGIIVELDFGKIEKRFRTTYLFIAENSLGNVTHTFVAQGHDFPSKPFHIHFKAFEGFALLEWEAKYPDTDMTYHVILINDTGVQEIFRIPGQNSKIYEYWLTNISMSKVYILQLCTTNVLGKNCSSTFKIKTDNILASSLEVSANQKPRSDTTFAVLTVVGGIGLLFILILAVIVLRHRQRRKRKNPPFFERQVVFGRNSYSMQGLTSELESSENTCNLRNARLSVNTYLTPQCMNSPLLGSTSCQSNSGGNEYASVDDPDIIKMSSQRNRDNGTCHSNSSVPKETNCSPNLPSRGNEYMAMGEETKGTLKSNNSKSTQLKKPGITESENYQITEYVSMDNEDEKKAEWQNGGYLEINYPKKYVRK
ncbi:uncharacterized protein LOC133179273 [Saccostrea echinata]|uniref:uncharacterized protein LOC133179273 n=1 Tax=Saccostrea echinata TaxID=191078 RepID=UPI002A7EB00C|nr:uncharacterized protein LOC133179273 [Saccostrea echinata]